MMNFRYYGLNVWRCSVLLPLHILFIFLLPVTDSSPAVTSTMRCPRFSSLSAASLTNVYTAGGWVGMERDNATKTDRVIASNNMQLLFLVVTYARVTRYSCTWVSDGQLEGDVRSTSSIRTSAINLRGVWYGGWYVQSRLKVLSNQFETILIKQ